LPANSYVAIDVMSRNERGKLDNEPEWERLWQGTAASTLPIGAADNFKIRPAYGTGEKKITCTYGSDIPLRYFFLTPAIGADLRVLSVIHKHYRAQPTTAMLERRRSWTARPQFVD
jgi:hypothetical protein